MQNNFFDRLKKFVVTFRFSILTIFILLFSIGVLSLISFTYYRTSSNINKVSLQLIKQISTYIYDSVVDVELRSAEVTSKSVAQLMKQNILKLEDATNFHEYFYNVLHSESLPIVQIVEWGDKEGNYFSQEREPNGGILTNIIQRTGTAALQIGSNATQTIIYRDANAKVIKTVHTTTQWDPRRRPWYLAAEVAKKFSWTPIFKFQHLSSPFLGTVAATPVYDEKGIIRGVVGVGIRIDYLARIIRDVPLSKNGLIFIVTNNKKIIATSQEKLGSYLELPDINSLNIPALPESFEYYIKTKQQDFIFKYRSTDYLVSYLNLPPGIAEQWYIGILAPEKDFIGSLRKDNLIIAGIGLIILILGIFIFLKLIDRIVKPLHKIVADTEKIKNFNLEITPPIQSRIKEVMLIANAITAMKQGLRSFQKYIPAKLVRQLIEKGEDAKIGGKKKEITVFFSDIRNFTTLSEKANPDELMVSLCRYFDELSHIITVNKGTIDKYIGDSIMAFWGALSLQKFSNEYAAKAALGCIKRSNELKNFVTCIGLHCGDAIVGNLGSSERLNYTAIGDTINTASRLEKINRIYGTQIIVSESVYQVIKDKFILRLLDYVILKGRNQPIYIYELLAEHISEISYPFEEYTNVFSQGFTAYQKHNWSEAIKLFSDCLRMYPGDQLTPLLIKRCEYLQKNPPEKNWNGAWVFD